MACSSRCLLPVVLLLLTACAPGTLQTADLYGAWDLVALEAEPAGPHVVGEELQLSPDGARFEAAGEARQVPFETYRGRIEFPGPGQPDEGLLVQFGGEDVVYEAQMPNRSTLVLVPNGIYGPILSYRRAR
jgi:hypothetical protein